MEFDYITKFHGIPWNSMESPYLDEKFYGIPWNYGSSLERRVTWNSMEFHGTLGPPNGISTSSMEFHGIPWNSAAAKWNITKFHGIPWNFEIVIFINTMLSWTSMGYTMKFHGTLEAPNKKSPSSMGFNGIRRAPFQMIQVFHGILNSGVAK